MSLYFVEPNTRVDLTASEKQGDSSAKMSFSSFFLLFCMEGEGKRLVVEVLRMSEFFVVLCSTSHAV